MPVTCSVEIEGLRRHGIPGMTARHDRPSEARARKTHKALRGLFSWLLRHRRVAANPMTTLHPPSAPSSRDRVLSNSEIRSFWAACETLPGPSGSVLRLLLIAGARLNEIAQLRDREEAQRRFRDLDHSRRKDQEQPRPRCSSASAGTPAGAAQERNGPFVFTTNGVTPASGWSMAKKRLDAAMGNVPAWVIHDLRSTAATHMAEIGVQPHIIEAVLNHVSGHQFGVAGIYNRAAYSAEKKDALERWAAHIQSIVQSIVDDRKVVAIRGGQ